MINKIHMLIMLLSTEDEFAAFIYEKESNCYYEEMAHPERFRINNSNSYYIEFSKNSMKVEYNNRNG